MLTYQPHKTYTAGRYEAVAYTVNGVDLIAEVDGYVMPRLFDLRCSDEGGPTVTVRFWVNREGRAEVRMVTVEADGDGREVQAQDLRRIALADLLETAVEMVSAPALARVREHAGPDASMDALVFESERMTAANPRGGVRAVNRRRLRVTPAQLRRVADIVRTCEGRPVDAVAEALDVGTRAAQLWIKRARDNQDPETGEPYLGTSDA